MKFTIFTSVYNRYLKLQRLVDSLLDQDYQNWELIIIDDGSDDVDYSEVEFRDNRIKKIIFKENRGHPEAIYQADILKNMNGDVITFMGSDDYFINGALNGIAACISKNIDKCDRFAFELQCESKTKINEELKYRETGKVVIKESVSILTDNFTDKDYSIFSSREYWKNFNYFFKSADRWYIGHVEAAIENPHKVYFNDSLAIIAGWSDDNITKGINSEKYFRWSAIYRDQLTKYKGLMSRKYLDNNVLGLSASCAIMRGWRLKGFKLLFNEIIYHLSMVLKLSGRLFVLLMPRALAHKTKKIIFRLRRER
jgi:glycosyltransferase involved in cell wall biosynthesis